MKSKTIIFSEDFKELQKGRQTGWLI